MPKYGRRKYRKRRGNLNVRIKKAIQSSQETKTVVLNYANAIQDSARTPLTNSLVDIDQGLTQATRVGNSVTVTSMKYEWFFTGADSTNSIRVIVYVPKDRDTLITALAYNQAPDLDQFTILRDMFICTGGTGGNCKRRNGWIRFNRGRRRGMNVVYTGALGTTVIKNNLHIYMVSDSGAVSDPAVNGFVRLYYKDS